MFVDQGLPDTSTSLARFIYEQPRVEAAVHVSSPLPWPLAQRSFTRSFDLARAEQIFGDLSQLEDDWDGYGAVRITPATCKNAKSVLEPMLDELPLPEISPNSNGTISMEWEGARGLAHLEIGLSQFSFFLRQPYGEPVFAAGSIDDFSPFEFTGLIASRLFEIRYADLSISDYRFAANNV